jgi:predicted chitinase
MNRSAFFQHMRRSDVPIMGTNLSQRQVEGIEALLDAGRDLPLHHMANVLAQVWRETGGGMYPIKETVFPSHKNKNPSDAEVIRRLDTAYAKGQLPWVKKPYWRDGWFGRGQIQITHWANYHRFGISNPDDALKLDVSSRVAVEGMRDGSFTGRKLADFIFPEALDNPPAQNPRRIVNGNDGSDAEVARAHKHFAAALKAGGWATQRPAEPQPAPGGAKGLLAVLWSFIASLRGK